MIMKDKVRPIYSELRGYLEEAPEEATNGDNIHDSSIWEHFNGLLGRLNSEIGKDYASFEIRPKQACEDVAIEYITVISYRQKLGGLIARLHGEYFSNETAPFSGMPSTVIHQTQNQSQTVDIQVLLDVRGRIEQELPKHEDGSDKKKFLQKVKESLGGISNTAQFFSHVLSAAKEFGLSPEDISRLLGF